MKKILVVFGTRPEAIKMCPLVKQLKQEIKHFDTKLCITGQHRHMLDQVLNVFDLKADYDLDIMKDKQSLTEITSNILKGLEPILQEWKPDIVLVHGDTATTFATSLACYYHKITVGHIEAGLRTGNNYSPWPEEGNRKLTASIATYHFAPTQMSANNLIAENIDKKKIYITGNTVIDAVLYAKKIIESNSDIAEKITKNFKEIDFSKKIILVTAHRRENIGEGIFNICQSIKYLAEKRSDIHIIYPVHLNPKVKDPVISMLSNIPNVSLIDPLEYLPFIYIMNKSYIILTDSGGIQEEAPSLGKPVLVMRNTTERNEALEAGTVKLVGTDIEYIASEIINLLDNDKLYNDIATTHNPYGDGRSVEAIIDVLKRV